MSTAATGTFATVQPDSRCIKNETMAGERCRVSGSPNHENERRQKSLNAPPPYQQTILSRLWRGGHMRTHLAEPTGSTVETEYRVFQLLPAMAICHPRRHKGLILLYSCNPLSVSKPSVVVICEKGRLCFNGYQPLVILF